MAILNNKADDTAMSLYYGYKAGHGHFDRLAFELFANGQSMMPDLGYPDAMNDFVPGIYTWSKNTIAHNTVVVDAKRAIGNVHGKVELFADGPFARVMDISGDDTYPQCTKYRRAVIMVDVDSLRAEINSSRPYLLSDKNRDGSYLSSRALISLTSSPSPAESNTITHCTARPVKFEMIGGEWTEPAKGTLAGEDVPLGKIYDDEKLDKNGESTATAVTRDPAFSTCSMCRSRSRRAIGSPNTRTPRIRRPRLRIRVLDAPDQQMMIADAHVSPAKHPEVIKYLIARHAGEKVRQPVHLGARTLSR